MCQTARRGRASRPPHHQKRRISRRRNGFQPARSTYAGSRTPRGAQEKSTCVHRQAQSGYSSRRCTRLTHVPPPRQAGLARS